VVDKLKPQFYDNLLSEITTSHMLTCPCQQDLVTPERKKQIELEVDVMKKEGVFNDLNARENRVKNAIQLAYLNVSKYCRENGIRCLREKEIITRDLEVFSTRYDLTDPRAYFIVESILSLKLSAYRLAMHCVIYDPVQEVCDKEGNTYYRINPAEEAKMKYNNSVIIGIKELNTIFEGIKSRSININFDGSKLLTAEEIFGKIDEMKDVVVSPKSETE
jgi:hypothetical protein